ncbi:hypothetical protein [Viridibacillus arvi]|uniref:hypothetical protein n=1 Tax=Viridibacillus arvi TaxID=263475 RepID=UPI0034D012C7
MFKKLLMTLCFSFLLSIAFTFNAYAGEKSAATSKLGLELDESQNKVLEDVFSEDELTSLTSKGFTLDAIELFVSSGESKEDILKREIVSNSTKYYITTTKFNTYDPEFLGMDSKDSLPVTSVREVSYGEFWQSLKEDNESVTTFKPSDYTTTSYKTMTVSVSKKKTGVYTVTNTVAWKKGALITNEDIIGIGINSNTSPIRGTEYGTQKWYANTQGTLLGTINYSSNGSKWNRNGDYGLSANLVNGGVGCVRCIRHTISMKYDIAPNVSNVKLIDAYGHYAHQEKKINIAPSFTISKGVLGISVSQEDHFTIHKPQPHAQIPK